MHVEDEALHSHVPHTARAAAASWTTVAPQPGTSLSTARSSSATAWGHRPRFLLRERDAVFGGDFAKRAAAIDVKTLLTPVRAPRANAVAERVIGTLRSECLDHLIVLNEAHLRKVLAAFTRVYHRDRPHRALHLQTPRPAAITTAGPIRTRPVLGGLHHVYERAA